MVWSWLFACSDPPPPPPESCANVTPYRPGMAIDAPPFRLTLLDADPDPPDVGPNTWSLALEPPVEATIVLEPWMPAHDHGLSPPTYTATPSETPGRYALPVFDLIMPGTWEFRFEVDDGTDRGEGSLTLCAEG